MFEKYNEEEYQENKERIDLEIHWAKQEWYKELWDKLNKIDQGEMTLFEYIKEVENKIIIKE